MRKSQICALLALCLSAPPFLFADFSYQESTQITGGSMLSVIKMAGALSSQAKKAGEPIVTSIYLKGNRMARVSPDNVSVIDLDQETITEIDLVKHTYTVMTFEQMKAALAQAEQAMQQQQQQQQAQAPPPPPANQPDNVQVSFDVHVRQTGATQQLSGLTANEAILTMVMNATDTTTAQTGTMAVTNDMWTVAEIPGYAEMRDFSVRMVGKLGGANFGSGLDLNKMLGQHPGANQALSSLTTEMQKVQGVPILQVMRLGSTNNGQPLPAASEAPLPDNSGPAMPSAGDVAKQSASSAISNRLGGLGGAFGGFGHKKPAQDQPPPDATPTTAPPAAAVLLESRTETSGFSSAPVDPSHFEVPQGYKQIVTAPQPSN